MFKRIWNLINTSIEIWNRAQSSTMAAALAFFAMLSLAPLLMMAISIAGFIFGDQLAEQEVIQLVSQFTTDQLAETIASLIKNATHPESGLIAGTISISILVFAASGVFTQLHQTFNLIWYVKIEEQNTWWFLLKTRLIGIGLVLFAGILLLLTVLFSTIFDTFGEWLEDYPKTRGWLLLFDRSLAFLVTPLVLSLFFWILPATKVRWRDAWPAGILTGLLILGSRYLIGFYLKFSTTSQVYGAAGSLVVLLIWIYITGMIVFYGAAFSHAWALVFGSRSGDDQGILISQVEDTLTMENDLAESESIENELVDELSSSPEPDPDGESTSS